MVDSVNHPDAGLDGSSLLRNVTRLYIRAQRQTVACCGPQSTARCHVLGELARCGPLRLTELAAHLDTDKSWTSRTVTAMVAEGLLSCEGAEDDARVVRVELTSAGRMRWQEMDHALRRHAERAFSKLSSEERATVYRGLALLRQVLIEETEDPGAGARSTAMAEKKAVRPRRRARRAVRGKR